MNRIFVANACTSCWAFRQKPCWLKSMRGFHWRLNFSNANQPSQVAI
jgi:hypothetical protein